MFIPYAAVWNAIGSREQAGEQHDTSIAMEFNAKPHGDMLLRASRDYEISPKSCFRVATCMGANAR
jgi:hypothetical protein